MNIVRAKVTASDEVMPRTIILRLESHDLATARPGQFVHIRPTTAYDPILRRPMSIYLTHDDGISVLVRDVGRGSGYISRAVPGQTLDVMGPLGKPFELRDGEQRLLMVGGGYGVAPLLGLALKALAVGRQVNLLVGAATAPFVFPSDRVPPGIEYQPATMDGSLGYQGLVTDLIAEHLDQVDCVYACGPTAMLEAVHRTCDAQSDVRVEVSMEQQMGCAMGVCLGCVIPTSSGFQRVCRDGPVFDASVVQWGTWNDL